MSSVALRMARHRRAGLWGGLLGGLAAIMLALAAPPAAAGGCPPDAGACARSGVLAAGVTQFRAGNRGASHWAQANLRIVNQGQQPLTLAYVARSGHLLDENGNRYEVTRSGVHGIGVAERRQVDTSFVLQPGEGADARFEFGWHRSDAARTGLHFEMTMALREVAAEPGGTVRLGREHVLRWAGLADGAQAPAAAHAAAAATATTTADAAPAASADSAAAPANLDVQVVRVLKSPRNRNENLVRVEFRAANAGTAPLILGYVRGSGLLIDDRGERYGVDWRYDARVAGIGQVERRKADPQFVLQPGAARSFALEFSRYGPDSGATGYSADLVLAQLEVLPGDQVRTLREHALSFPQLSAGMVAPGAAGAAAGAADLVQAVESLRDLFRKK